MYVLTKLATNPTNSSIPILRVFNGYSNGDNPSWNIVNSMHFQMYLFYELDSAMKLRLNSKTESVKKSIIMNIDYLPYFRYKAGWQTDIYEAFTIQYNAGNFTTDMFITSPRDIDLCSL